MTITNREIVVHLPTESLERLQEWAKRMGTSPEALTQEIVEQALEQQSPQPDSSSKNTREILEAAGLVHPLSPRLRNLIIPGVTLEQVRTAMARAGGPSLSEIIMEQRGPRS